MIFDDESGIKIDHELRNISEMRALLSVPSSSSPMTDDESVVLELFRSLTDDGQRAAMSYLRFMSSDPAYSKRLRDRIFCAWEREREEGG